MTEDQKTDESRELNPSDEPILSENPETEIQEAKDKESFSPEEGKEPDPLLPEAGSAEPNDLSSEPEAIAPELDASSPDMEEPGSDPGPTAATIPDPQSESGAANEAAAEKISDTESPEREESTEISKPGDDQQDFAAEKSPAAEEDFLLPHFMEEEQDEETSATSSEIDYSTLSKAQIIKEFRFLLESRHVNTLRSEVDNLKINFYKRHKQEIEKKRKTFYEQGGALEDFQPEEDPLEIEFKEAYKEYRRLKALHNRELEDKKVLNLHEKQRILEELKELVNRKEDVNRTFQEFRDLQKKWHATGMVPQQHVKDLWENYHLYVEQFYDHIKINKELRDLDLKKNMEAKITLCEKAEELLLEPHIINAFRMLQRFHDQWREIGPVPMDQKEVIWERFREITHQINKKHQEHYDHQRDTQRKNLEAKAILCEKAETLSGQEFKNVQEIESLTREILGLQKMWKTIGFAPRKDNNKIYQRFRTACDAFFTRKREFNAINREHLGENLQRKLDLCVQAEALQESTEWKRTTEELISLQRKWKEIGPVPRKYYDTLWKRFRSACDTFFNRKSEYFSNIDSTYEDNLRKKLDIIQKIETLDTSADINAALNKLKEYQRQWSEIGFVPIKSKEEIQKRYRSALDKHFENLKVDDQKKNILRFRNKLETMSGKGNVPGKMKFEREKYMNKLKQLESDITLWENNIGFFAKSKNADAMVKEFTEKIEQGKMQIKLLEEKINMIDELDQY